MVCSASTQSGIDKTTAAPVQCLSADSSCRASSVQPERNVNGRTEILETDTMMYYRMDNTGCFHVWYGICCYVENIEYCINISLVFSISVGGDKGF